LRNSTDIDRLLADPKILAIPSLNRAIDTVGLSLSNLFKIFYPNRIFLVGSFIRNAKIVERLENTILRTLFYAKMRDKLRKINLVVIPDGFAGCARANAYPFFRTRLKELLTARN
jgi:predicted NBD/HSP70 family sugar kinase